MTLFDSLVLANGAVIPNRLCKAAMEENMSTYDHAPSEAHYKLYRSWAEGGAGLILSGNVMIDRRALTGPGGVILENDEHLDRFREWARAGRSQGSQFWLQINHPGRQVLASLGQETVAPSAVALELGALSRLFPVPREMTEDDIQDVIRRFAQTSSLAQAAGFSGVEIHAAHGYLLSQFLSPRTNRRTDRWGGSLENRVRLLIEVIKAVRSAVSPTFCVGVKLNSADFQRGGFDITDARTVLEMLNALPVDLVELSGGNYEAPAMQGDPRDGRTLAREAYFLEFAKDMVAAARMPLMVTGGIRRREVAELVLASGVSMVGMASALALEPSLPRRWRRTEDVNPKLRPITWSHKMLAARAYMASIKYQMRAISLGKSTNPNVSPLRALIIERLDVATRSRQYRRWMKAKLTLGPRVRRMLSPVVRMAQKSFTFADIFPAPRKRQIPRRGPMLQWLCRREPGAAGQERQCRQ
jgi:2,4-dienoyl-CoA reductase-like NADH-dependent reductase (Old Yellow Enzyme family)